MQQPPDDPWLNAAVMVLLLASVAIWLALLARLKRGQPLLDYEPRSPVPWGAPVALLALVFTAITLLTPGAVDAPPERPEPANPLELSQQLAGFIFFQSAVIGGIVFVVAAVYRPSLRDFGLPEYADQLASDIGIGIIACLAALAPVYGVQALMLSYFGPSNHPLVEMVMGGEPNIGVVFLASVAAVVVAPIGEEILFRLLLQGWLEKWEDRRWGWRREPLAPNGSAEGMTNDECGMTNSEGGINDERGTTNDKSAARSDSSFGIRDPALDTLPPRRGLLGLPHGWLPIISSSLLFALAHFGYGPDPIAIFVLALILGYVYQRTHRITPCIVAHALFNSLAVLILWRTVFLSAE
jgi:membrane protease YdiL (CAAX protease family)